MKNSCNDLINYGKIKSKCKINLRPVSRTSSQIDIHLLPFAQNEEAQSAADVPAVQFFLSPPPFCTQRCAYGCGCHEAPTPSRTDGDGGGLHVG